MDAFLASEFKPAAPESARIHVIPVPMETSVSYGGGTAKGPAAILAASQQLEAFDGTGRPGEDTIHTQRAVKPAKPRSPEAWVDAIEARVVHALSCGAAPLLLGGEHTVTLGAARAFKAAGLEVGFVHFDAHADLRDVYEETPFSHACVMRRVHELGFPLVQIGTRAYAEEEQLYRMKHKKTIRAYDAATIAAGGMPVDFLPKTFPKLVFVTFDVDGFDPAVMPATGTPVPGGLFWFDAIHLLDRLAAGRTVVGADVVELAPIKHLHHADFTAARLAQHLISLLSPA